jgi:hypothetical protein
VVTVIPPGSTASLPVPMPTARPGTAVQVPTGTAESASPSPNLPNFDRGGSEQIDHEQLVQQLTASAVDLGDDLTGLALPPKRPESSTETANATAPDPAPDAGQDDADTLATLPLPPRRPASIRAAAKSVTAPLPGSPAEPAPSQLSAPATAPQAPLPGTADAPPSDPNAPTELAALSSPKPPIRPARPLVPVKLPSASILPVLGGTSSAKVRAAATEQGLTLDQTALIGVLNLDGGRKALLRLPDGRYKSVVVGDLVDGWSVSSIGVDAMKVSKSGQDKTLRLVNR